jgi:hypothetical protein
MIAANKIEHFGSLAHDWARPEEPLRRNAF